MPEEINLISLNGTNGFALEGETAVGRSASGVGDINGDGIDDLIIGGEGTDTYVVFGSATEFSDSFDVSGLDGSNGFVINGGTGSSSSVSGAGDINGDGLNDLIIGYRIADPNNIKNAGESYVVFGSATSFSAELDVSSLDGSNGFVIQGFGYADYAGTSVSGIGDINGDGLDDVIVGAPGAGDLAQGQSYVVFGSTTGFSPSLDASTLNGTNGFLIEGISILDRSGASVSGAGDINNDGVDDIVIGARDAPASDNLTGQSYVVFGSAAGFGEVVSLADLNGSNGFVIDGLAQQDALGNAVSSAGDVNGDGIDDLLIGAYRADPNGVEQAGTSYVIFGGQDFSRGNFDLANLDGSNGFSISGVDESTYTGLSLSAADVNGDGLSDLILSGGRSLGSVSKTYVIFGSRDGFGVNLSVTDLDGSNGYVINGTPFSFSFRVSGAGDINNDGIGDILLGGATSYVVFGILTGARPLILNPDENNIAEDADTNAVSGNVLENDVGDGLNVTSVDGDPAKVGQPVPTEFGSITIDENGDYTYTLDNDNNDVDFLDDGDRLSDIVEFTVSGSNSSATSEIAITINGTDESIRLSEGGAGSFARTVDLGQNAGGILEFSHNFFDGEMEADRLIVRLGDETLLDTNFVTGTNSGKFTILPEESTDLEVTIESQFPTSEWEFEVEFSPLEVIIDGKIGDVIEVDVPAELAKLGLFLEDIGLSLGNLALESTENDRGRVAAIDNFQNQIRDEGKFFFVPTLETTIPIYGQDIEHPGLGKSILTLTTNPSNNGDGRLPIVFRVNEGFSTKGQDAEVTFDEDKLSIFRQQQRISYLGFPDNSGTPLTADGEKGTTTGWAISLFNAAVNNTNHSISNLSSKVFDKTVRDYVNNTNAPQWNELRVDTIPGLLISKGNSQTERWATNWTFDALQLAVSSLTANSNFNRPIVLTAASLKPGGNTPYHSSHEAGMDLDIDTPGLEGYNAGYNFFKEITIDDSGIFYVEAPGGQVILEDENGVISTVASNDESINLAQAITGSKLYNSGKAFRNKLYIDSNGNNQPDADEWLLQDNPEALGGPYVLEDVRTLISTFINTGLVEKVFFNDPRTWDLGNDLIDVDYAPSHNGHIHFDVSVSALAGNVQGQNEPLFLPQESPLSEPTLPEELPAEGGSSASPSSLFVESITLLESTLDEAENLGIVVGNIVSTGEINSQNTHDFFQFIVGEPFDEVDADEGYFFSPREVTVSLSGLSADLDLELGQDVNGDGIRQDNEILAIASTAGNATETITFPELIEGPYFINVLPVSGETEYTLDVFVAPLPAPVDTVGNTLDEAFNLGELIAPTVQDEFVGEGDRDDYYQFTLTSLTDLGLEVTGLANGNIFVELGKDENENGVLDSNEVLGFSDEVNMAEAINAIALESGDYFIRIARNSGNTDYTLALTPTATVTPPDQAGNAPAGALDVNLTGSTQQFTDFVGTVDPDDFYQFTLDSISGLEITLDGLVADADLELAEDSNGDGTISPDEIIAVSELAESDAETITVDALAAGTYFVRVHQFEGETDYELEIAPLATTAADLAVARIDTSNRTIGQQYTYTLEVTNSGPNDAPNVQLTELLPSVVSLVEVQGGTLTGTGPERELVLDLGTVANGETKQIEFTVRSIAAGLVVGNSSVSSDVTDPTLENNTLAQRTAIAALNDAPPSEETPPTFLSFELSAQIANSIGVAVPYTPVEVGGINLGQFFDNGYYLRQNSDVAQAIFTGSFTSGYDHFVQYGWLEGRDGSVLFNEQTYLATYTDVADAVNTGLLESGFQHFLIDGHLEGREPGGAFSQTDYLLNNPDIDAAVQADLLSSGFEHYVEFGANEGRFPGLSLYQEDFYLAQNSDIADALASGVSGLTSGLDHFLKFGSLEGRDPSPLFSNEAYLAVNPDIGQAIAQGLIPSGFIHYAVFGAVEGRPLA